MIQGVRGREINGDGYMDSYPCIDPDCSGTMSLTGKAKYGMMRCSECDRTVHESRLKPKAKVSKQVKLEV